MSKKFVGVVLVSALAMVLSLVPANAVWKGSPNLANKRVVPIFNQFYSPYCSSAFLYAPRIVFTAAHVMFNVDDREQKHVTPISTAWVGFPNSSVTAQSKRIKSQKIFIAPGYKSRDFWLGGNTLTRENDFAVVVLEAPLPVDDKKVELLTSDLHDQYINSGEEIDLSGYGRQTPEGIRNQAPCQTYSSFSSKVTSKVINTGSIRWTAPLNTLVGVGMPNLCDSDSGAGYSKILEDRYIYLGAAGAGSANQHNCASFEENLNKETINGAYPVYLYTDLIAEAEKFVAENPYVEPKMNNASQKKVPISCVKGKNIKKVSGANPKCPKGYKQK
jgi:hypothetical protein